MTPSNSDKTAFFKMLNQPDDDISLAKAALMVAKLEYPDLNIDSYLLKIQNIAEEINNRLSATANAAEILKQLNHVLFVEKAYEGNTNSYYDPRNSFLNDVIDRKLGIPISLSILYIELGHALGLPLSGIAFPGHFLVKLEISDGAIVLDPYFGGISLNEEDIEERLREYYGAKLNKSRAQGVLSSSSNKEIVLRVMRNLRNLYMQDENWIKALPLADIMVEMDDDKPDALKARAAIYDQQECHIPALADYSSYLKLSPNTDTPGNQFIRARVIDLAKSARKVC
ncbi:MAG: transglutaminase-like domain-containing protein [Gammaproteobacteria bacterium]|nr:transglutaminase-like domain-containing protein [Gammaproteobacteria bacterium]